VTPSADEVRNPPWLPAACASALAIVLYAHTLAGTWVYDDRFHAHDDPRLADVSKWHEYLTEGYYPGGVDHLWRPLVSFSYAIQWKLGGGRAWSFHLVNVLLHAAASALVAELARRLTGRATVALIAGLLFAAHPLHVEAVAYIVGRADSACAVGTLGAMVLLLGPMSLRRALGAFACFLVALLSKEQGLLLPPMLLALWRLRHARFAPPSPAEARAARLLLVLVVFTLAIYVACREHILPWYWETTLLDRGTQPMVDSGPRDRALIPIALLGRALALVVLPIKLSPEYGLAVITSRQTLADPFLYLGAAGLLAGVVRAVAALRARNWNTFFLLVCAALTYFMVANVKLIGVVFAERLLYLPSAFVLILAAMALARLPGRIVFALLPVLLLALVVRTVTYAARWNDRLAFYEASVRENPAAVRLRVLLATELIERHRLDDADAVVRQGLALVPEYWGLWSLSGRIALEQGRLDDAKAAIERAWERHPFIPELLGLQGKLDELRARSATRPAP
jgi:hypothetical protein